MSIKQNQGEPVAWWIPKAEQFCLPNANGERPFAKAWEPLYTTPQPAERKRTWVGLTDEQIETCYETTGHYQTLRPQDRFAVFALAKAIEAKLKEKNT